MNVAQIPERSLSLLRLLTNYCIDKDTASILLDGEPMEVILDIQTVLLIGIVAEEREEDALPDPQGTYERCRARTQVIGDYYEEIQKHSVLHKSHNHCSFCFMYRIFFK